MHKSNFTIAEETREGFSLIRLQNNLTGEFISVIPELGARLFELVLNDGKSNYSLLRKNSLLNLLDRENLYTNAILFPFAGRIKDGKYVYENQTFQLHVNYPEESNACHGFVFNKNFVVKHTEIQNEFAVCVSEYFYKGDEQGYPFEFGIEVSYKLDKNNGLTCTTVITNNSKCTIPFSGGWHPYFDLGCDVDNLELKLDVNEMIKLDSRNIPNGERIPVNGKPIGKINSRHFDNCFKVNDEKNISSAEIYCKEKDLRLSLWQETGFNKYNYIVIYTTPDRKSIAIEPMTSNVDAFNNGENIIQLNPYEHLSLKYGVSIYRLF